MGLREREGAFVKCWMGFAGAGEMGLLSGLTGVRWRVVHECRAEGLEMIC